MDSIGYSTEEYFPLFCAEVEGWIHRLGLLNWRVTVCLEVLLEGECAQCCMEENDRTARISMARFVAIQPTERDVALWAFHEVGELLMADVEAFGNRPHPGEQNEELRRLTHEVIVRLENTLFDGYWKAKQQSQDKPGKLRPNCKRPGHKNQLNG